MAAGLRHQVTHARSTYSSLSFLKVQLAARASVWVILMSWVLILVACSKYSFCKCNSHYLPTKNIQTSVLIVCKVYSRWLGVIWQIYLPKTSVLKLPTKVTHAASYPTTFANCFPALKTQTHRNADYSKSERHSENTFCKMTIRQ